MCAPSVALRSFPAVYQLFSDRLLSTTDVFVGKCWAPAQDGLIAVIYWARLQDLQPDFWTGTQVVTRASDIPLSAIGLFRSR
jgi:hypothetical protein